MFTHNSILAGLPAVAVNGNIQAQKKGLLELANAEEKDTPRGIQVDARANADPVRIAGVSQRLSNRGKGTIGLWWALPQRVAYTVDARPDVAFGTRL